MKRIMIFDCETTGLPEKGHRYDTHFHQFPQIVNIAWTMMNLEDFMYLKGWEYIIRPEGWEIPAEATEVHGITNELALEKGTRFPIAMEHFMEDAMSASLIAGFNIYFDTSMIKANLLRRDLMLKTMNDVLDKSKRVDLMQKTNKFVGATRINPKGKAVPKFPTLDELHFKLFNCMPPNSHTAMGDTQTTAKCFIELVKIGVIKLQLS